jgi:hypothetical protein
MKSSRVKEGRMLADCPYCEWSGSSRGIKSHVRMAHPDHYTRWTFDHVDDTKGKIRKDLLKPESMQEKTWYNRLKRTQTHDDAKKMVLVDGNMQPVPKASETTHSPESSQTNQPIKPQEFDFQCSNCEHMFNDPVWDYGEAHCPKCEEVLDKEFMYDD